MPKSSGTRLNREFRLFGDSSSFICSSITRHLHELFKTLALQYQQAVRPHACARWLKCLSYAAPVEFTKGGRVGVKLINQHVHSSKAQISLFL